MGNIATNEVAQGLERGEMNCIRCGRVQQIEEHHIQERCRGGGDEPENKEPRCRACHKYEHAWRAINAALEYERKRGQQNRIRCYEHRLEILERFNTPQLIRERGTYLSYWSDTSTRYLPLQVALSEAMNTAKVRGDGIYRYKNGITR